MPVPAVSGRSRNDPSATSDQRLRRPRVLVSRAIPEGSMNRRKFIAVLGGAAVVAGDVPMLVWAQQVLARAPDEMPRVVLRFHD